MNDSSTCPCTPASSFFCAILQRRLTPELAELCRTRPDYRAQWERRRDGEPLTKRLPARSTKPITETALEHLAAMSARPNAPVYRTPDQLRDLLTTHCLPCPHFHPHLQLCTARSGCHRTLDYHHSLIAHSGTCPTKKW